MKSNIFNVPGARVEQLGASQVSFLNLQHDGSIAAGAITIALDKNRVYVIDRITIALDKFVNTDANTYAYPKWEQFALEMEIKASIGNGSTPATILFDEMLWGTSDGISNTLVFNEPFVFTSNASNNTTLILNFENVGSVFSAVTGVPPAAAQVVNVNGIITFEGYSFAFKDGSTFLSHERNNFAQKLKRD